VANDENHHDDSVVDEDTDDAVAVESADDVADTSGDSQELEPVAELNESQVPSMIRLLERLPCTKKS
jgi:hypothetical protein